MDKKTKQILMVAGGAFLVYMLFFRKKAEETVVVAPVDDAPEADPEETSGFSRVGGYSYVDPCAAFTYANDTFAPIGSQNGGFANGGIGGQGSGPNGRVTLADCQNGYYGNTAGPSVGGGSMGGSMRRPERRTRGGASGGRRRMSKRR